MGARCLCHGKRIRGHSRRWDKENRVRRHQDLTRSRRPDIDPFVEDYVKKQRQAKILERERADMAVLDDLFRRVNMVHVRQQLSPVFVGGIDTRIWWENRRRRN